MIKRCGVVAIVGRPNVGKSTLMNHLLGVKISITSRKPQTTRDRILGIHVVADSQIVFVDTPGIHKADDKAINRHMNKAAILALNDVDAVLMMVDRAKWVPEDDLVLRALRNVKVPVILVVNKIDQLDDKQQLLPFIADEMTQSLNFHNVLPISALNGHNLEALEKVLAELMPEGDAMFAEDQITDRSMRFLAAELVREKLMRQLGEEVPYGIAVQIESYEQGEGIVHIDALILVESDGQKAIVIGKAGQRLKQVGQAARLDIERLADQKVMLNLWVKVRKGWSDDIRALQSLGYTDQ